VKMPWSVDDGKSETVLNQGTEFTGSVLVKGPVHIHGRIDGDVHCEDHLVVGKEGLVRGNISARLVSISGRVDGRIDAVERVELLDTANLTGEIFTPRLTVIDGAIFEGYVHMPQNVVESVSQLESKRVEQLESRVVGAPVVESSAAPEEAKAAEEPQEEVKPEEPADVEESPEPKESQKVDPRSVSRTNAAPARRGDRPPQSSAVIKG